jgi:hypothetical protein
MESFLDYLLIIVIKFILFFKKIFKINFGLLHMGILHTLQPNKLTKHKLSQTLDKKWATTTSCATLSPRSKSESPLGPD